MRFAPLPVCVAAVPGTKIKIINVNKTGQINLKHRDSKINYYLHIINRLVKDCCLRQFITRGCIWLLTSRNKVLKGIITLFDGITALLLSLQTYVFWILEIMTALKKRTQLWKSCWHKGMYLSMSLSTAFFVAASVCATVVLVICVVCRAGQRVDGASWAASEISQVRERERLTAFIYRKIFVVCLEKTGGLCGSRFSSSPQCSSDNSETSDIFLDLESQFTHTHNQDFKILYIRFNKSD